MIKVLLADDHPVVREGLKRIIAETHDITVAGEAGSGLETIEKASKNNYDVIVLDIALPDMSGLEALKEIRNRKSKAAILILSMYPEEEFAVRAFKEGAAGYVAKKSAAVELTNAIRKVYKGYKYVSPTLAEKIVSDMTDGEQRPLHEKLSNREFRVLRMIAEGKRNKEIAGELLVSPKTISSYRARILQKMNMTSNAELARYALKHKLLE